MVPSKYEFYKPCPEDPDSPSVKICQTLLSVVKKHSYKNNCFKMFFKCYNFG